MNFIKKNYPLLLITILGIALRYFHNIDISLWHDEAFSALYIKYNWAEMMYRIGLDVHPPAYYVALRLWHYIFADSLLSLRSFSVLFGVAIIPATYLFVKEAFHNHKAALWVALLIAINPFQIEYVSEVRMYTFGAFWAIISAYFLVKALHTQRDLFESQNRSEKNLAETGHLKNQTIGWYVLFAITTSIMMYTHYYLFFTAAALGFYGLTYHWAHYKDHLKKYLYLLGSFGLIGLFYLPWLKTFLFQFKQVSGSFWIPPMDVWSIPTTIWQMLLSFGIDIRQTETQIIVVVAVLFSLLFLYQFLRKTQEKEKWLVLFGIIAPFAGSIIFVLLARLKGESSSVYLVRYFLFASLFYSIALGMWFSQLRPKTLGVTLLSAYCILNLAAFANYWHDLDVKNKPGMAAASKFLNANVSPTDKLYIGSSFEFFNFKYYNQTSVRPLLYSGGNRDIKNLPHFAGTAILTNSDLLPDFTENVKAGDKIWLLWTNGFGGSKPAVPANWEQLDEKGFAEVRPYVGTWILITQYVVK